MGADRIRFAPRDAPALRGPIRQYGHAFRGENYEEPGSQETKRVLSMRLLDFWIP